MYGLYLGECVGLVVITTDFHYGFKDVRVKLPLLIIPIIFSSMPVFSDKQFKTVALVFAAVS